MSEKRMAMMPWFPDDFAGATAGWTFMERSLYRCLLDAQWTLTVLPSDLDRLARIAQISRVDFEAIWPVVSMKFQSDGNGGLLNARLEEHRKTAKSLSEKRSAAAKSASQKRWTLNPNGIANGSQTDPVERANGSHPSPSPSPSPSTLPSVACKTRARDELLSFAEFKATYPAYSGSQSKWLLAERACLNQIDSGASWAEIVAGARRYAAYIAAIGKTGSQFVLHPDKFCANRDWAQDWPIPVSHSPKAATEEFDINTWVPKQLREAEGAPE